MGTDSKDLKLQGESMVAEARQQAFKEVGELLIKRPHYNTHASSILGNYYVTAMKGLIESLLQGELLKGEKS
jgi:hypothetical protein